MNATRPEQPQIVMRPVADLVPYARNARTHSDAQVAQIAAMMERLESIERRMALGEADNG